MTAKVGCERGLVVWFFGGGVGGGRVEALLREMGLSGLFR